MNKIIQVAPIEIEVKRLAGGFTSISREVYIYCLTDKGTILVFKNGELSPVYDPSHAKKLPISPERKKSPHD